MSDSFWNDVSELEKLAKEATPGPWETDDFCYGVDLAYEPETRRTYGYGCDNRHICDLDDGEYHEYENDQEREANCKFIAAANPKMVGEIIRMVFRQKERIETLEKEADWLAEFCVSLQMCPMIMAYKCRHLDDNQLSASECVQCWREAARKTVGVQR